MGKACQSGASSPPESRAERVLSTAFPADSVTVVYRRSQATSLGATDKADAVVDVSHIIVMHRRPCMPLLKMPSIVAQALLFDLDSVLRIHRRSACRLTTNCSHNQLSAAATPHILGIRHRC